MILLADHQDSFTRNLEHLRGFDEVLVRDRREINDEACQKADLIVLSPGPGNPDQYPETQALCRAWTGQKPILGVCLGFQLVLQLEGARIIRQSQVLHGVETEIDFDPFSETYSGLDQALRVARYHSLRVDPASLSELPKSIRITASCPIRDTPLSFEDLDRAIWLAIPPDLFTCGKSIIENARNACMD